MKKLLVFGWACLLTLSIAAQSMCGLSEQDASLWRSFSHALGSPSAKVMGSSLKTIPVAVNIIYQNNFANPSDAQAQDGVDVLIDAFSGFYGGVDTKIRFCLAGINRVQDASLANVQLGNNELAAKQLIGELPYKFLNVWLVESLYDANGSAIQGWTPYPQALNTSPDYDGVMLVNERWGRIGTAQGSGVNDLGRVGVHEVGHYLGLLHPFDGGCDFEWNCSTSGDCCCDTPPVGEKYDGCKRRKNTCQAETPDLDDPIHNYMMYTDDECRTEFTQCQSDRMNYYLETIRFAGYFETGDCPDFKANPHPASVAASLVCWPIPAQDQLHVRVELGADEWCRLELVDALGRVIWNTDQKVDQAGNLECRLELRGQLGAGIYYLRLRHKGGVEALKVVVE